MNYVKLLFLGLLIHSYSSIQAEPIYASFMQKGKMNVLLYGDDASVTDRNTYDDFIGALKQLAAQDKKVLLLLEDGRSLSWADKIRQELPKKVSIKNMGDKATLQLCYAFENQKTFSKSLISNATIKDLFYYPAAMVKFRAKFFVDQTLLCARILHVLADLGKLRAKLLIDMLDRVAGRREKACDILLQDVMRRENNSVFEPWLACFANSKEVHLLGLEAEVAYAVRKTWRAESNGKYDTIVVLAQHEKVIMLQSYLNMLKFRIMAKSGIREQCEREQGYEQEESTFFFITPHSHDWTRYLLALRALRDTGDCPTNVMGCYLQITSKLYSWFLSRLEDEKEWRWIKQEKPARENFVIDFGGIIGRIETRKLLENPAINFGRGIGCIESANASDFSQASYAWMYETPQKD